MDSDNRANMVLLREMVSGCLNSLDMVLPLYTKYLEMCRTGGDEEDVEIDFGGVNTLRQLPPDLVVDEVAESSDLEVADIVQCMKYDAESAHHLLSFWTQLPLRFPWAKALCSREMSHRILCALGSEMGNRLANVKSTGAFEANGFIDWAKVGCYIISWSGETGRLESIRHCSGDVYEAEPHVHIYRSAAHVEENWSDFCAFIRIDPLPPVKLHDFFKKGMAGPYKVRHFSKASKDWDRFVSTEVEKLQVQRNRLNTAAQSTSAEAAAIQVHEMLVTKKQQRSEVARDKARKVLEEKSSRKRIKL